MREKALHWRREQSPVTYHLLPITYVKIAVAQIDCEVGAVDRNLAHIRRWARAARDAGCDVIVLPEMADTGYVMDTITSAAQSWDRGAFPQLSEMASELGLHIICGLSERSDQGVHNAVAVLDSTGKLLCKYRKVHLFTGAPVHEEQHLVPGDQLCLVEVGDFRWGVMVCYDLRFPEMARAMALQGADVIVVPSAFPFPRLKHWTTLLAARAIENQVYIVAANRVGTDGSVTFCGASQIIDPYGVVIATAPEMGEILISGELETDVIAKTRASLRVFEDRVPSVYRRVENPPGDS